MFVTVSYIHPNSILVDKAKAYLRGALKVHNSKVRFKNMPQNIRLGRK
jgi:hypothetical protein